MNCFIMIVLIKHLNPPAAAGRPVSLPQLLICLLLCQPPSLWIIEPLTRLLTPSKLLCAEKRSRVGHLKGVWCFLGYLDQHSSSVIVRMFFCLINDTLCLVLFNVQITNTLFLLMLPDSLQSIQRSTSLPVLR